MTTIAAATKRRLACKRMLEMPAHCPGRLPASDAGTPSSRSRLLDRSHRLTERDAGARLKLKVTAGKLALVIDRQERGRRRRPFHQRAQRHLLAGQRRLDVDLIERRRRVLYLRQHLHDHVIAVDLREVLRDLAFAERSRRACRR